MPYHTNFFIPFSYSSNKYNRIPENRKSEAYYNGADPNSKGDDNPDIEDYFNKEEKNYDI